jgi:hypothetical protein
VVGSYVPFWARCDWQLCALVVGVGGRQLCTFVVGVSSRQLYAFLVGGVGSYVAFW